MSGDILSKHLQLLSPKGAILKLRHLHLAMLAMVIAQQL
jgi:propanediol utilization protein